MPEENPTIPNVTPKDKRDPPPPPPPPAFLFAAASVGLASIAFTIKTVYELIMVSC